MNRAEPLQEELVFGPTVEGLFVRGLRSKLSSETIRELRQVGVDVEKPMLPAYPRGVISQAVGVAARALYPELEPAQAWYQIGKHVSIGLKGTTLSTAALAVLRLIGPRRAMGRLAKTFRSTNNYMRVMLRQLAPNHFELDLEPSNEQPSYMQAVIEDVLGEAGAKSLVVKILHHDRVSSLATYGISWS